MALRDALREFLFRPASIRWSRACHSIVHVGLKTQGGWLRQIRPGGRNIGKEGVLRKGHIELACNHQIKYVQEKSLVIFALTE